MKEVSMMVESTTIVEAEKRDGRLCRMMSSDKEKRRGKQ